MNKLYKLSRLFGNDSYAKLALAVIIIGAIVRFSLAALSHPAGDSCWHLSVARFIAENGRIPLLEPFGITDRQVFTAPPLFHLIAAAVYKVFSLVSIPAAELAYKLVSPLFGALTLPVVFLLGRKLYNPKIAFWATFFLAFLPLHMNSSVVSFVDSLTTLLAALAVYFLVSRRVLAAAVFLGLGLAAKQTMIALVPVFFLALAVFYRKNLKALIAKSLASALIAAVIGLPWLIRNYVLLKNPVWPFLYKLIGGTVAPEVAEGFSAAYLFSAGHALRFFLELMGAPLGSLGAVAFLKLPFAGAVSVMLAVWLALVIIFSVPVIAGVLARGVKHRWLLYAWMAAFLLVTMVYIINVGMGSARFFLASAPALAIIWAVGIDRILGKAGSIQGIEGMRRLSVTALVIMVVVGSVVAFAAVEAAKTITGANEWAKYEEDFSWIRQNTPQKALIGYRGQCMSYNVHRFSNFKLDKVDYLWVNQGFRLEPISILEPQLLGQVQGNFTKVYDNSATGTVIYKRK
ncbi:glycosyltransferase family 39 protein [Candidatus Woesearchaeota archaeon]|nr:glycosyltransferase family 39 protein [Candidatus Woesearchaeota archaeon]